MSFLINPYIFGGPLTDNLVLYTRLDNNTTDETGNFTINNLNVSFGSTSPPSGTHYAVFNSGIDYLYVPNSSIIDFYTFL